MKTLAALRKANSQNPQAQAVADEATQVLLKVMRGEVKRFARERMAAADRLLEQACGLMPKPVEISGPGGKPFRVRIDLSAANE